MAKVRQNARLAIASEESIGLGITGDTTAAEKGDVIVTIGMEIGRKSVGEDQGRDHGIVIMSANIRTDIVHGRGRESNEGIDPGAMNAGAMRTAIEGLETTTMADQGARDEMRGAATAVGVAVGLRINTRNRAEQVMIEFGNIHKIAAKISILPQLDSLPAIRFAIKRDVCIATSRDCESPKKAGIRLYCIACLDE